MAAGLEQPAGNHKKTDITVNTALPESIPDTSTLNFRGENVHSFYAFLGKIAACRMRRTFVWRLDVNYCWKMAYRKTPNGSPPTGLFRYPGQFSAQDTWWGGCQASWGGADRFC
jgi:hypothetical protein